MGIMKNLIQTINAIRDLKSQIPKITPLTFPLFNQNMLDIEFSITNEDTSENFNIV